MKLTNQNDSFRPTLRARIRSAEAIAAFTLIEMLVYIGVFTVLSAVGFVALYRSMDHSFALRRSSDDIIDVIHAGDDWRADVRSVQGQILLETNPKEQILHMPGAGREVSYRFATNTIFRRIGENAWSLVLGNVKDSKFTADQRNQITAWRWELELEGRAKRPGRLHPLFTFIAVPLGESTK
jgi:type II secretory pathway pseudopilin PulG